MVEGDAQDPQKPAPVADPLLGRTLNDRFRIIEPIGSGGMGKVYKAVQAPLDRVVALKVLNPNFPAERDPNFKKRFLLEASLTSKLRHPNTVTVIDYGQTEDNIFYIAMEFLSGHNLSEVLAKEKLLPWTRAIQIGQQICRSLREAHKLGVVHRDLKPANVMLLEETDHDVVKVLDFGLVKSFVTDPNGINPEVTQQGTFLGSPQYMAPEQARNNSDPRSDVYSLGILLYQMMAGRPPFVGKDYLDVIFQHLKEAPQPLSQLQPDAQIPQEIEAVVMRCLEKDPAKRYQSMDELLEAMRLSAAATGALYFPERTSPGFRIPKGFTPPAFAKGPTQVSPPPLPSPVAQPTPPPSAEPDQISTLSYDEIPAVIGTDEEKPNRYGWVLWTLGFFVFVAVGFFGAWALAPKPAVRPQPPAPSTQATIEAVPGPTPEKIVQAQPTPPPQAPKPQVRFHVTTEPAGAHVYLGRKDMGTTPVTFEVPAGPDGTVTEELVFVADGFYPLNVVAGGSGDVVLVQKLQKRMRERVIRVTEPGPAEVSSAGPQQGTPTQAPTQPPAQGQPQPAGPSTPAQTSAPKTASATPTQQSTPSTTSPAPGTQVAMSQPSAQTPANPVVPAKAIVPAAPKTPVVLPFGDGMSPPMMLEGKPFAYTREALAARVEGTMLVKCRINVSGRLENCRVLKGVPLMEQTVLSELASRRYTPVTYQGKPVAVDYLFTIRLQLPQR